MAAENIGSLYNTKMPGYDDAADIQAALKLFLYGSETYDTENTDPEQLPVPSLAHHLKSLQDDIDDVDAKGIGSDFSATEPATPTDGFIWVNSSTSFGSANGAVASYQNAAPTTGVVNGQLWVDKDSSPLKMYVYDATSSTWKEIGA
jgi:hypothetical protein